MSNHLAEVKKWVPCPGNVQEPFAVERWWNSVAVPPLLEFV